MIENLHYDIRSKVRLSPEIAKSLLRGRDYAISEGWVVNPTRVSTAIHTASDNSRSWASAMINQMVRFRLNHRLGNGYAPRRNVSLFPVNNWTGHKNERLMFDSLNIYHIQPPPYQFRSETQKTTIKPMTTIGRDAKPLHCILKIRQLFSIR